MKDGRKFSVCTVFIILLGSMSLFIGSDAELRDENSLEFHGIIDINGDSQFTSSRGVSSGNGTSDNPYIIENLTINVTSSNEAISIQNTDSYVKIRNCLILNPMDIDSPGIRLTRVSNLTIEHTSLSNSGIGIWDSTDILTKRISTNSSKWGLWAYSTNNLTLEGVLSSSHEQQYMYITNCIGLNITDCEFRNGTGALSIYTSSGIVSDCSFTDGLSGISIDDPGDLKIISNQITGVKYSGIRMDRASSFSTIIANNSIENCGVGISIGGCESIIKGNIIRGISGTGMIVSDVGMDNNTIIKNSIHLERGEGIVVGGPSRYYSNELTGCGFEIEPGILSMIEPIIPKNNTVNGKSVFFFDGNDGDIPEITPTPGQVILANMVNRSISNIDMGDSSMGILIGGKTENITVNNLTVSGAFRGLRFYGLGSIIKNSKFSNCTYGIYHQGMQNDITDNIVTNCSRDGIYTTFRRDLMFLGKNRIERNYIHHNYNGIETRHRGENIINNSIVHNDRTGLYISLMHDGQHNIEDNTICYNGYNGVHMMHSRYNVFYNNNISFNSGNGVNQTYLSTGNRYFENTFSYNGGLGLSADEGSTTIESSRFVGNGIAGIYISDRTWDVWNCTFEKNPIGIYIYNADGVSIEFNKIQSNIVGISINYSKNIHVIDNILDNSENAEVFWCEDILFDRPLKKQTNIIGGPYKGGNYWSDYHGADTDFDGIGNTGTPHGPGDYLPLVRIPSGADCIDLSDSEAFTGEDFDLSFQFIDLKKVMLQYIVLLVDQYDIEDERITRETFDYRSLGRNNFFNVTTTVWENSVSINYYFTFEEGYYGETTIEGEIPVKDVIPPEIYLSYIGPLNTGENSKVRVNVMENIKIEKLTYEVYINGQEEVRSSGPLIPSGIYDIQWNCSVDIPEKAENVSIRFISSDIDGLETKMRTPWFDVNDTITPKIRSFLYTKIQGERKILVEYELYDNIGVESAEMMVEFYHDHSSTVIPLSRSFDEKWIAKIEFPDECWIITINSTVLDLNGNFAYDERAVHPIMDIQRDIRDGSDLEAITGKPFNINISASIEIGEEYFIQYRFDEGTWIVINSTHEHTILSIPISCRRLDYGIVIGYEPWIVGGTFTKYVKDGTDPEVSVYYRDPINGENWDFRLYIEDNHELRSYEVSVDFGSGPEHINSDGEFNFSLTIPSDITTLQLTVIASDMSMNHIKFSDTVSVLDRTSPNITSIDLIPIKDRNNVYLLRVEVEDNRDIDEVRLNYSFDGNKIILTVLDRIEEGVYEIEIERPDPADDLTYTIKVLDDSGNEATSNGIFPGEEKIEKEKDLLLFIVLSSLILVMIISMVLFLKRSNRNHHLSEE